MKIPYFIVNITLLLLLFNVGGFAQSKECDGFDTKVTFKILGENITTKDSRTSIFLLIYVQPERFTIDSMIKLVERIRKEYCQFDGVSFSIRDTKKLDKMPDPPPHPLIDWQSKTPPRGFYEYDKQANTAELTFREKRNDKVIDVEIIFRPDGYCVSETSTQPSESK